MIVPLPPRKGKRKTQSPILKIPLAVFARLRRGHLDLQSSLRSSCEKLFRLDQALGGFGPRSGKFKEENGRR